MNPRNATPAPAHKQPVRACHSGPEATSTGPRTCSMAAATPTGAVSGARSTARAQRSRRSKNAPETRSRPTAARNSTPRGCSRRGGCAAGTHPARQRRDQPDRMSSRPKGQVRASVAPHALRSAPRPTPATCHNARTANRASQAPHGAPTTARDRSDDRPGQHSAQSTLPHDAQARVCDAGKTRCNPRQNRPLSL